MPLEFTIDLDNQSPETVESGNKPPPGMYRCKLEDVWEDENKAGLIKFKYHCLRGAGAARTVWDGRKIFDQVGDPDQAEKAEAADFIRRRIRLLAKRFGLLADDDYGKTGVQKSWYDALGQEFIVHVKARSYAEKVNGAPTGNTITSNDVDFAGVYPLNYDQSKLGKDLRAPFAELVGGPGATTQAAGGAATATASGPAATGTVPTPAPPPPGGALDRAMATAAAAPAGQPSMFPPHPVAAPGVDLSDL